MKQLIKVLQKINKQLEINNKIASKINKQLEINNKIAIVQISKNTFIYI